MQGAFRVAIQQARTVGIVQVRFLWIMSKQFLECLERLLRMAELEAEEYLRLRGKRKLS